MKRNWNQINDGEIILMEQFRNKKNKNEEEEDNNYNNNDDEDYE
jgi:hypothetical protein